MIHFLWFVKLDRILHNQMRLRRGITNNSNCKLCNMAGSAKIICFEFALGLKKVWSLVTGKVDHDSGDTNFFIWLDTNLKSKDKQIGNMEWNIIFTSTIWHIWKMRNDFQFRDNIHNENSVAIVSLNFARDVTRAFGLNSNQSSRSDNRLIGWSFPFAGCIKINTDRSSNLESHRSGFGGLVRTDQGKWVEGFCGYIGYADSLKAELWGIRHALSLCKERNWTNTVIETDCLVAVKLIMEGGEEENHPNRILIDDCKVMATELEASIVHILRETNRCADILAHMGSE